MNRQCQEGNVIILRLKIELTLSRQFKVSVHRTGQGVEAPLFYTILISHLSSHPYTSLAVIDTLRERGQKATMIDETIRI